MESAVQAIAPTDRQQSNAWLRHWCSRCQRSSDSKHGLGVPANVLNRQFEKELPTQGWVCDITCIHTRGGWLYLAAVLDLHSRKVVRWATSPALPARLMCVASQMAIVQRNPAAGLIVYSSRGTQYTSNKHQALLKKHALVGSMRHKGNCGDYSVMQRFFLNLKMKRVWRKDYANHAEAKNDSADYIVWLLQRSKDARRTGQHVIQRFRS